MNFLISPRVVLLTIGLGLVLLLGCRSSEQHYQRTSMTLLEEARAKRSVDSVLVHENPDDVVEEYEVIALMHSEGVPGEGGRFREAFRQRAADVGADALIFKRVDLNGGSGVRLSNVAAFRGEAIVFR